ncbi:MAG TPA: D-amino-acid transaminase [Bacillota bacterium]|nr:D-amino-acid transaminase [Bacillota bacterium]
MEGIAYVNCAFMSLDEAKVSIEDRGFQFGDGVYEVIKTYNGIPFAQEAHLERLERSANMLELPLPKNRLELEKLINEAVRRCSFQDAIVYLQITRGCAPRLHAFPNKVKPTLVLTVRRARPMPEELYEYGASAIIAPDERWLRCDIKSICLLPNVLAKEKASRAGAFEAILTRNDGRITEGTTSNVFIVKSGKLYTAPEGNWILSGVTRAITLRLARREGITVIEDFFSPEILMSADEVFITNTSIEVMPVVSIDKQPIGDGQPGQVTRRLAKLFKAEILQYIAQAKL